MDDPVVLVVGLAIGAVLGGAGTALVLLLRRRAGDAERAAALARADALDEQARRLAEEASGVRRELAQAHERREAAERQVATLEEQLRAREASFEEQKKLLAEAEQNLKDAFQAVGAQALDANNQRFLELAKKSFETLMARAGGDIEKKQQAIDSLVKPLKESLEQYSNAVRAMEQKREGAYGRLDKQLEAIANTHTRLDQQTGQLVAALSKSNVRGQWGEIQLERVVELAGMTRHCDFHTQPPTDDPTTRDRPDMTVHLPGGGMIVVDSKVSLDAYLKAIEPDADRASLMKMHAQQVQKKVRDLANAQYWRQFDRSPELVVMFTPLESSLTAAMEVMPELHAEALQRRVLIATPTLLIALLCSIAYGWQQEDMAANSRQIAEVGSELYKRIRRFVERFIQVGKNIQDAGHAYNDAVGSLEHRVEPSMRKLRELHVTTDSKPTAAQTIEMDMRPIVKPELRLFEAEEAGEVRE